MNNIINVYSHIMAPKSFTFLFLVFFLSMAVPLPLHSLDNLIPTNGSSSEDYSSSSGFNQSSSLNSSFDSIEAEEDEGVEQPQVSASQEEDFSSAESVNSTNSSYNSSSSESQYDSEIESFDSSSWNNTMDLHNTTSNGTIVDGGSEIAPPKPNCHVYVLGIQSIHSNHKVSIPGESIKFEILLHNATQVCNFEIWITLLV